MNFDNLQNELLNLNTNAKKEVMSQILNAEARRLEDSLVPLNAIHKDVIKREKEERCMELVAVGAVAAGAIALAAFAAWKIKKGVEKKAAEEKAKIESRLQAERKEMIQKLARIKGRA